jgi:hypothetical protein
VANEDHTPGGPPPDVLFRRLRAVSVIVILGLIVFLVVVDALGRLIVDPSFRVSEVFLGTLVGALTLALGLEITSRLPIGRSNGR